METTLLIVDDEENILSRIEKYIRNNMSCFSEIYTALNGQEALDIIFRFKPDVCTAGSAPGAFDYLLKPCRSTEICERLRAALGIEEKEQKPEETERMENPVLRTARKYIKEHLTENLSLSDAAEKAGVSTAYLSTLFSQHMGYENQWREKPRRQIKKRVLQNVGRVFLQIH